MVEVCVKASIFRAIKPGTQGEVIETKYLGTTAEILKVRFRDGSVWSFRPDELKELPSR